MRARIGKILFVRGGTTDLLPILASGLAPVGISEASHATDILNRETYMISPEQHTAAAPSLVGWFYLLEGKSGVLLGIQVLIAALLLLWVWLGCSKLHGKTLAQALSVTFLVPVVNDGVLDGSFWTVFSLLLIIVGVEFLLRSFGLRRRDARPAVMPALRADP